MTLFQNHLHHCQIWMQLGHYWGLALEGWMVSFGQDVGMDVGMNLMPVEDSQYELLLEPCVVVAVVAGQAGEWRDPEI